MTIEDLKNGVPKHAKGMITQNVVDVLNHLEGGDGLDFAEHYKQNFITLSRVMKSGEFSMKDYISAIKFVSYKLLENSDVDAYMMTFPDRYARLLDQYAHVGDEAEIRSRKISPFVSAYKGGDLVVKLMEQSLVPSKVLNAPMFQDALNIQMGLAMNARSEMVQMQAANSILTHLKQNDVQKIELEVGIKGQDEVLALREEMTRLAAQQQASIAHGANTSLEIAESTLLHEVIEVEG